MFCHAGETLQGFLPSRYVGAGFVIGVFVHFIDPLKKLSFASQYGKQVLQQLRVRPSTAVVLAEPHLDSTPPPDIPALFVPAPEIYEEHQFAAAYQGLVDYQQHEQFMLPEMSLTPQFRLESAQPIETIATVELSVAAEICQAIDDVRHPDSIDGLLQHPNPLEPYPEQGLENLLDDPLLGPLGPLF